jgi:hypothetical protein
MWHVQTSLHKFMRDICNIVCICVQCCSLYEFCATFANLFLFVGLSVMREITNGGKTAVIDLIGFLCVSLGSGTVQLHDNLGSVLQRVGWALPRSFLYIQLFIESVGSRRACACSEASSIIKMATVLEERTAEELLCFYCG